MRGGPPALAALFVLAGALVNALYLATGTDYAAFADASPIAFVRETWRSVVGPDQWFWIGGLIVFEAAVGLLVLRGGRATQVALVTTAGFHVALLSFGWFFWAWSLPMLLAVALLLRAERAAAASTASERADSERGAAGAAAGAGLAGSSDAQGRPRLSRHT